MLTLRLQRPAREDVVAVPFRAVYGGDRLYKLEEGRMVGVTSRAWAGASMPMARSACWCTRRSCEDGDLIVITHMPNAMDGLRVEGALAARGRAETAGDAASMSSG
jgi:HlyD family secretion protein